MVNEREIVRLHIGGTQRHTGWHVLNIQPGPHVDFVGSCTDLSRFADASISDIYASHVMEHLGHRDELKQALGEFHRVLTPGGRVLISVPDLMVLSGLFAKPGLSVQQRYDIMLMMFGGQLDSHDFHKVGLWEDLLAFYLMNAGFKEPARVADFGLFDDYSRHTFAGVPISLNMVAVK